MKGFMPPSLKAVNAVRKKYDLPTGSRLSAAQFREAQEITTSSSRRKGGKPAYSFEYYLKERTDTRVVVFIKGKHLSNNRYNALPLGQQISYRTSFKKGADKLFLLKKNKIRSIPPFNTAVISFEFLQSVRSRDHDNNGETQKRVQDTLVRLGFVKDDKRTNIEKGEKDKETMVSRGEEGIIVTLCRI